jgi:hypothetical protein
MTVKQLFSKTSPEGEIPIGEIDVPTRRLRRLRHPAMPCPTSQT